jgi:hypothetical protein
MQVAQLHTLINAVTQEILGESGIVQDDLSNVVDIGKAIVDSDNVDNYVKKLVNHIGKVVFTNRLYTGGAPSVLMDSWEFGSILQKVSAELPAATANESWDLTDGDTYNQDVFYKPKVSAKFFNSKVTFEIPLSFTERQVKESFSSREQLNGFISLLTTAVENSLTVKIDALIMRTISNMKAVNLLAMYNATAGTPITAAGAVKNADFIRFATYQVGLVQDRMAKISTLFNVEGKERFTPKDLQKVVLLSDFAKASETFLASNTYNAEKVALPAHDAVPYWQGSGTKYAFTDVSTIKVKTASGDIVNASGVLGVVFDRDALGVTNLDRRVTTNYNAKAEFFTNFYKFDAGYFNDLGENFVVFYVADAPVTPTDPTDPTEPTEPTEPVGG